ncbi:MAG: hypothetical protein EKK45_24200 [Curvibacter sp.]|nr:MAG: hypothetical protein EKK45_24200 [Curvibacter sp.]
MWILSALLAGCGSVPLSSLWQLRSLRLEELDPAALRAALVAPASLRLNPTSLTLDVTVTRELPPVNGQPVWETLEEKLPLEELRGSLELSPLVGELSPGLQLRVWRIAPASLERLQALRGRALAWKGSEGKRRLGLGLAFEGCQPVGASRSLRVSTLLRFKPQGEYIAVLRDADLAALLPKEEQARRFPACAL